MKAKAEATVPCVPEAVGLIFADDGSEPVFPGQEATVSCDVADPIGTCASTFPSVTPNHAWPCVEGGDPLAFDDSCDDDGDCAIALLQTDCCGSTQVTAVAVAQASAFSAAAAACVDEAPLCDCVAFSSDDFGRTCSDAATPLVPRCIQGTCAGICP